MRSNNQLITGSDYILADSRAKCSMGEMIILTTVAEQLILDTGPQGRAHTMYTISVHSIV